VEQLDESAVNYVEHLKDRVRRGESLPQPLDALLQAATPFVQLGMAWRLSRPRVRVAARVVSFGNLTAGGTGKTPAVIERARAEIAAGKKVAILTRGYGASSASDPVVLAPGGYCPGLAETLGDEPALIARCVPEAFVIKCADRVAGARMALEQCGCQTLILDDGYQYVMLERDENILVVDASCPFGNGWLLPRGTLREPLEAMRRATALLLTRCDQAPDLPKLVERLAELCPGVPVRKTWHAPSGLWRVRDGREEPVAAWEGRTVHAVCGIGHPEAFFRTIESLGMRIERKTVFPNHSRFSLEGFSAEYIIMTEKDAVRLTQAPPQAYALAVRLMDA